MTGRRSGLPDWLQDIGARRPTEELEDSGTVYYGRHLRSADGSLPAMIGPPVMDWGTITSLTLPADNGTWALGIVTGSKDKQLRSLREVGRWEAVVRSLPLVAHWLDGTPIEDGVRVIARLEDRYRGFAVDGRPLATGVVAVADSWACSNPANGRGASIGILHALTLRGQLRAVGLDDPAAFAEAFHSATAETVEPWYRVTSLAGYRPRAADPRGGFRPARTTRQNPAARVWLARSAAVGSDPRTAPRAGVRSMNFDRQAARLLRRAEPE